MIDQILGVIGATTGLVAAVVSVLASARVSHAERKLLDKLRGDVEFKRLVAQMDSIKSLSLAPEDTECLRRAISRHVAELPKSEQRDLKQVLEQPSAIGRRAYVAKLADCSFVQ